MGRFLLVPLGEIQEILSNDEAMSERTSQRLLLNVKFRLPRHSCERILKGRDVELEDSIGWLCISDMKRSRFT